MILENKYKMDTLIDKLTLRRLCLPSTTDIKALRAGKIRTSSFCECGNSHHIACAIEKKGSCFKSTKLWNKHV